MPRSFSAHSPAPLALPPSVDLLKPFDVKPVFDESVPPPARGDGTQSRMDHSQGMPAPHTSLLGPRCLTEMLGLLTVFSCDWQAPERLVTPCSAFCIHICLKTTWLWSVPYTCSLSPPEPEEGLGPHPLNCCTSFLEDRVPWASRLLSRN